jgi:Cupin
LHPRGDELFLVIEGTIFTQFISEAGGALISNEFEVGGATMFPKGSVHYEFNPKCSPASFVAAFNSNDPGVTFIASGLVSLEEQIVIAALGGEAIVSGEDLASIVEHVPQGLATQVQQCLITCGLSRRGKRSLSEVLARK